MHATTRRRFLRYIAGTTAGIVLTACGASSKSPSNGAQTSANNTSKSSNGAGLTIWGWEGTIEGVQSQISQFSHKHNGMKVDVKKFGYEDIHTNLLNAIVAGSGAPDLCAIDVTRLTQYTDGLSSFNAELPKQKSRFVPPTIFLGSYKGKFYGLATDSEPIGMFYRKDLWDQYGVKETDISTWADLAAASNKMHDASGGKVNLYGMTANLSYGEYEILANQQGFGGYYFNDDDTKVIVDDPKVIDAVSTLKQLWDGKGVQRNPNGGYSGNEMTALLKSGRVASQIIGPGWYPQTLTQSMPELSGKWRLMRSPAISKGGSRASYQYPTIFVVPSQGEHRELAWELEVMGLTGDGAGALFDKFHVLPAYKPLFDKLLPQKDKYFGGEHTFQLWNAIAEDAPKIFFGQGFTQAQQIMSNHLTDVYNSKKTPAQAMKEAAQEMRSKLKKG